MNSKDVDWSRVGLLVDYFLCETHALQFWRMFFVSREGNNAAHSLSKFATRNIVDKQWLHDSPNCILDIIMMEQVALSC